MNNIKVTKTCIQCGTEFKTGNEKQTCCSRLCLKVYRVLNEEYDDSLEWREVNGRWQCPYNVAVECETRTCSRCGWNPRVAKARAERRKI